MADAYLLAATQARDALTGTRVTARQFAQELARRCDDPAQLEALNVADLFLAFAALEADPAGLTELDRRLRACAHKLATDSIDDLLQMARQRLLMGNRSPKLRSYEGHGSLVKWLRTVLLTLSIDVRRKVKPDQRASDEQLAMKASGEGGADVRLMNAHHRTEFNKAFAASLAGLTAQERTVLRMRFVDQLAIEDIGRAFGVHRTTAMRWLEHAFAKVLNDTRAALKDRLKLDTRELDSLLRAFEPSLSDRLSRLLPALK